MGWFRRSQQEKWIAANLQRIHVPIQIGVGAAFDFHSGHVARRRSECKEMVLSGFTGCLNKSD